MKNNTRARIIEIINLLSGSILPMMFWICLVFGFDTVYVAILTLICALLHELGHIGAIHFLSGESVCVRGHSSGFRIKRSVTLSYKNEIAILLAGPLANILVFIVCLSLGGALDGYIRIFGYINLATGLSNLLPIEGYDGYGALVQAFYSRGKDGLVRWLEILSFTFSVFITFISLHLIDRFSEGYWIFGLFFFATVSKLIKFEKYDIFER